MFDKMKELMEMKRKMEELKRELDSLELAAEDSLVKVTITASQEVKKVEVKCDLAGADKGKLEASVADTVNRAIKQSQKTAAERMHKLGGLGALGGQA
ncbi:MAG TPA: YbaB/EbfC family nucleoid-associated protein [Elusimicrobiales bacterium]|nr:YbaB/EbfC family nucleoid-associated protein [Elusimicrobiales bacterium]